ncbi:MAG TPA: ATP-dependent zinc metalloprotease FtsH [Spirochaetota bacterium]|nr:ATP-dependent zinc metalloprotease FtsH [Spirochaetota bacterium]HOJ28065.1 ATP-dependent zinc metalloprotease FtsH [Spirochaetota bacterium]HOM09317.1 ATP-dependent zinc metalloprotease FtsH [Spirochaetota bacterium]HPP50012.1 ATP-dependent zinc metalloprotease FtsH [Spirochaetota bacterium]
MNKAAKQVALLLLIALLAIAIFRMNDMNTQKVEQLQYSDFIKKVYENKVKSVTIVNGKKIEGTFTKGDKVYLFETVIPYQDPDLIKTLINNRVEIKGEEVDDNLFWKGVLNFLPWLLFFGFIWFFMIRQIQSTGNKAMSFGKVRAKLQPETKNKVTFADVAGVDEAKVELQEIIEFLKDPKKFITIGAKIPKGVLLVGPPGTGKTLLARAVAGEAGVPFFSISGSDFVEMFVGVGASRVRDLFDQGKRNAPCIIFIDEIDAVGRLRGAGLGGGHDEREQTLNQLLVEMDGFETNEGVIIVAATNRPDVLDPALLRPGRFDRQVVVDIPDIKGREKILAVHTRKIPLAKDVDLKVIARGTPGFTGADLANLVNEAALLAARRNKKRVSMLEMEDAKDKVLMGPERKSVLISAEEKKVIAYHEAGHALLGILTGADPVHKVTVIPRGRALGLTMHLPKEERHLHNREYWLNQITILFGGHVAEKIKFGQVTTGSSNDIERATDIARRMVCEWGMSETLGPLAFGKKTEQIFLAREIAQHRDYSEETAQLIDKEVHDIVTSCRDRAIKLIEENSDKFELLATNLIERETLNAQEIELLMKGEPLPPIHNGENPQQPDEEPKIEKIKKKASQKPLLDDKEVIPT